MIAWAVALVLALRLYMETVMTSYYVWPALAVGLVVAARELSPIRHLCGYRGTHHHCRSVATGLVPVVGH